MKLLDLVVSEYINIVDHLLESEPVENNRIIVEREIFKALLEKYAYLKFSQKTKIYKKLGFIIHDKNNYTMPYRDKLQKKTIRQVIINYETYMIIKDLYETSTT